MKKWLSLILCLIMVLAMIPAGHAADVEMTEATEFTVNGGDKLTIYTYANSGGDPFSGGLSYVIDNEKLLKVTVEPQITHKLGVRTSFSYRTVYYFIFEIQGLRAGSAKIQITNSAKTSTLWTGTVTVVGNAFIDMKEATIEPIEDQVYTGKEIKPALTVKNGDRVLTEGTDYEVSFKDNKNVGVATATVKGIEGNEGSAEVKFNIVPKAPKLSGPKAGKKLLTVKWKQVKGVSGYQVEYSLNEDFSGAKKKNVNGAATLTLELKKLKSKKVYYIRVRAFQKVGKKTLYSPWSNVKSKKTK